MEGRKRNISSSPLQCATKYLSIRRGNYHISRMEYMSALYLRRNLNRSDGKRKPQQGLQGVPVYFDTEVRQKF